MVSHIFEGTSCTLHIASQLVYLPIFNGQPGIMHTLSLSFTIFYYLFFQNCFLFFFSEDDFDICSKLAEQISKAIKPPELLKSLTYCLAMEVV